MKILQIIAHPAEVSFTRSVAAKFVDGATAAGHDVHSINLFDSSLGIDGFERLIEQADHLNFAWPCLWELPPAKLVDFFQTVFVKGFAFTVIDGKMVPRLNLPVTCLISMGRDKSHNTVNLSEAMAYCGLHPTFTIFNNVGPRLTPELADIYMDVAYRTGFNVTGK